MKLEELNKLRVSLGSAIQEWAESTKVQEVYDRFWGEETVSLMTEAALAVLRAVAECQDYAQKEGLFMED